MTAMKRLKSTKILLCLTAQSNSHYKQIKKEFKLRNNLIYLKQG